MTAIANPPKSTEHHSDQDCGICQKPGAQIFWMSPYSLYAHSQCVEAIDRAALPLIKILNERFPLSDSPQEALKNMGRWNQAHSDAIRAVKLCCAPLSLRSFQEEHGVEALASLFNTVGVQGATGWRSRL